MGHLLSSKEHILGVPEKSEPCFQAWGSISKKAQTPRDCDASGAHRTRKPRENDATWIERKFRKVDFLCEPTSTLA